MIVKFIVIDEANDHTNSAIVTVARWQRPTGHNHAMQCLHAQRSQFEALDDEIEKLKDRRDTLRAALDAANKERLPWDNEDDGKPFAKDKGYILKMLQTKRKR